jgi:hypothetical protein
VVFGKPKLAVSIVRSLAQVMAACQERIAYQKHTSDTLGANGEHILFTNNYAGAGKKF